MRNPRVRCERYCELYDSSRKLCNYGNSAYCPNKGNNPEAIQVGEHCIHAELMERSGRIKQDLVMAVKASNIFKF